ncbi:MAG: hypothetical protein ABI282_09715, partial [Candidatus Baltobacteraceae bacterium]
VLLCAVPLHAVDWNLKHNAQNPETPLTHNCWFSDGGLSSNFPIQFFDAPIPGRPTFGINLRSFDDTYAESPDERNNVWMPEFNDDVISNSRNGFDDKGANLPGFLSAIIDTMQNWNDNLQAQVPGFRDRIVHVFLSAAEGGLNLDMPENVLATLSRRGECAGDLLVQRFTSPSPEAPPQTTNWENHRWVRFRTATSVLEQFVVDFTTRYLAPPDNGDTAYPDLVQRKPGVAPFGYALGVPEQQRFVAAQTAALASSGIVWANAAPNDFREDSPEPMPELQVRPRI